AEHLPAGYVAEDAAADVGEFNVHSAASSSCISGRYFRTASASCGWAEATATIAERPARASGPRTERTATASTGSNVSTCAGLAMIAWAICQTAFAFCRP